MLIRYDVFENWRIDHSSFRVNFRACFHELLRFLFHPTLERFFLGDGLFGGVVADGLGDLHGWRLGWRRSVSKRGLSDGEEEVGQG